MSGDSPPAGPPHPGPTTLGVGDRNVTNAPVMLKDFVGVTQAQTEWCWAGALASIFNHYRALAGDSWLPVRQCDYVRNQFNLTGCSDNPRPESCLDCKYHNDGANVEGKISIELDRYDLLACDPVPFDGVTHVSNGVTSEGGLDFYEIQHNIDNQRPIAIRTVRSNPDGTLFFHFIIITGYQPYPGDGFFVWNPAPEDVHMPPDGTYVTTDDFIRRFGTPTYKYLTKSRANVSASTRRSQALAETA